MCLGRCPCLACVPTCLIDVHMHVCTSPAAIQLKFCGVFGVLQLARTICMLGHHNWHIQWCIRLYCASTWALYTVACTSCPLPSSGTLCASATLSLIFSSCLLSSSYRCACWSFSKLHALLLPSSTSQILIASFPSSTAISSTPQLPLVSQVFH